MSLNVNYKESFQNRHIGPNANEKAEMLKKIGVNSIEQLIDETIPAHIRFKKDLNLPTAMSEADFLQELKTTASKNKVFKSYIGQGYYNTFTPQVIQRNILENPGWYTAYTPYQAEIAQGRLEALINFQTTVMDLTGMEIANASLLDEGTAAAEAMHLAYASRKGDRKTANTFFVDDRLFAQTKDVLKTRSAPYDIELKTGKVETLDLQKDNDTFAIIVQYPNADGAITDFTSLITAAHEKGILVIMAADLLALTMLKSPGEMGADIVVGTTQRFGVPMGFGGPHAAFFATSDQYKRQLPGRIIGVSQDADGNKAYRMALQTREQHIRREKATSNICTAQVLLAVIAGAYAAYHGPKGLKAIAERTHGLAKTLAEGLNKIGVKEQNGQFFDTIKVSMANAAETSKLREIAERNEMNFFYNGDFVHVSLDETTTYEDVLDILRVFADARGLEINPDDIKNIANNVELNWEKEIIRTSSYLTHEVFNSFHAEHEMLRYLKRLENKDLSLAHSMISLGSCTMKLNATTEMVPVTWPEFCNMHPFAPADQTEGYLDLINELDVWMSEITGFAKVTFQPNSGAQGEYAGLMVIRAYHHDHGDTHRDVCIIPTSAHGTNPASAVMAGMKVVLVQCDEKGNIDVADLKAKAEEHTANLAALMVTYPSTHGVFEESITDICQIIHDNGGLVYMDGANMNAQVGLTSPANIGADVCHLNLHKTFCIPHGGGGPGVGPIGVVEKLVPYLPGNPHVPASGGEKAITAISAAPYGSADILTISYAYVKMMGGEGLKAATQNAILNANYMKALLEEHFPILYKGTNGRCAHEMIVDFRQFKHSLGVEVEDVAKRLMDYGYHAPTVSFPVAGTLMIEPTESENKAELDRFCEALIAIKSEIDEIASGNADKSNNVLKNAPHTAKAIISDHWDKPYGREKAAYPLEWVRANKFWPSVARVDNAYGDRNLYCACIPTESYAEAEA